MGIKKSKNIVLRSTLKTGGGNIHIGDNYYKSIEYKEFEKKIKRLERLIQLAESEEEQNEYESDLKNEQKNLKAFEEEIISLAEKFQKIDINTDLLIEAKSFFDKGEFEKARQLLNPDKISEETNALLNSRDKIETKFEDIQKKLKTKANEFLVLAKLTNINFALPDRIQKADEYYKKSLNAFRYLENIFSYATFLKDFSEFYKSIELYKELLEEYEKSKGVYYESELQNIASISNNLGDIYLALGEYKQSEKYFSISLKYNELLFQIRPEKYAFNLGMTHNNIGLLKKYKKEYESAWKNFEKALTILTGLCKENPFEYSPNLAMIHSNLGELMADIQAYDMAIKAYDTSLELYELLVESGEKEFLIDIADVLFNKGRTYIFVNNIVESEKLLKKALEMYSEFGRREIEKNGKKIANTNVLLSNIYQHTLKSNLSLRGKE